MDIQLQLRSIEQNLQTILTIQTSEDIPDTISSDLLHSLHTTETELEQGKLEYELLKTTQSSQLSNLESALQSARAEYETAYTNYNKRTIRAPFAGTIKEIYTEIGETVFSGEPIASIISKDQPSIIEIDVTFNEYLTILDITEVFINNFTGSITSRSLTTNEKGKYTLTIESIATQDQDTEEKLFAVQFPLQTDFYYLPKEIVEIINQNAGFLYLVIDDEVQKLPVTLGNERNERIEITEFVNPATQIITNWKNIF